VFALTGFLNPKWILYHKKQISEKGQFFHYDNKLTWISRNASLTLLGLQTAD